MPRPTLLPRMKDEEGDRHLKVRPSRQKRDRRLPARADSAQPALVSECGAN